MDKPESMRIGLPEREDALATLAKQLEQGRLTPEEFRQLSEEVSSATTIGALRNVFSNDRLGHMDRQQAHEMLRRHFSDGQLTSEEFFERSAAISMAKSGDDLIPIFGDLTNYRSDDRVRIGTAERDDAMTALSENLAAGRLTAEEFSSRAAALSIAKIRADVRKLFTDLPASPAFLSGVATN